MTEPVRTDKGMFSEADMDLRIRALVERERGSYSEVTVRHVEPMVIERKTAVKTPNAYRKGSRTAETLEDRVARERRRARVRLEEERRTRALLEQFGGLDDDGPTLEAA